MSCMFLAYMHMALLSLSHPSPRLHICRWAVHQQKENAKDLMVKSVSEDEERGKKASCTGKAGDNESRNNVYMFAAFADAKLAGTQGDTPKKIQRHSL